MVMPSGSKSNPVVEVYRGVKIRKYPIVKLRTSQKEMKRIIDAIIDYDLSIREVFAIQCMPCEGKGSEATINTEKGERITIQRGILIIRK